MTRSRSSSVDGSRYEAGARVERLGRSAAAVSTLTCCLLDRERDGGAGRSSSLLSDVVASWYDCTLLRALRTGRDGADACRDAAMAAA